MCPCASHLDDSTICLCEFKDDALTHQRQLSQYPSLKWHKLKQYPRRCGLITAGHVHSMILTSKWASDTALTMLASLNPAFWWGPLAGGLTCAGGDWVWAHQLHNYTQPYDPFLNQCSPDSGHGLTPTNSTKPHHPSSRTCRDWEPNTCSALLP